MQDWNKFLQSAEGEPETIGDLLKQLREEAGYTQNELAQRMNLSRYTVINIENNEPQAISALKMSTFRKWHRACRVKASTSTLDVFKKVVSKYLGL